MLYSRKTRLHPHECKKRRPVITYRSSFLLNFNFLFIPNPPSLLSLTNEHLLTIHPSASCHFPFFQKQGLGWIIYRIKQHMLIGEVLVGNSRTLIYMRKSANWRSIYNDQKLAHDGRIQVRIGKSPLFGGSRHIPCLKTHFFEGIIYCF